MPSDGQVHRLNGSRNSMHLQMIRQHTLAFADVASRQNRIAGMMPAYAADLGMMGIKVISAFSGNRKFGYPSHQVPYYC